MLVITHCRLRRFKSVGVGTFSPMNDCLMDDMERAVDTRDDLIPVTRLSGVGVQSNTTHAGGAALEVAFNVLWNIRDAHVRVHNLTTLATRQVRHCTMVGGNTGLTTVDDRQESYPQSWPTLSAVNVLRVTGCVIDGPGDAVIAGYTPANVSDTVHSGDLSGAISVTSGNVGPEIYPQYQDDASDNYRLRRAGVQLPDAVTYPLVDSPGVLLADALTTDAGAYHRGVTASPLLITTALQFDSPRTLQIAAKSFGAETTEGVSGWHSTAQGQADAFTLEWDAEDAGEQQRTWRNLRAVRASRTEAVLTRLSRVILPLDTMSPEVIRIRSDAALFAAWELLFNTKAFAPGAVFPNVTNIARIEESTLSYPGEQLFSGTFADGILPVGASMDWLDGSMVVIHGANVFNTYNTTGNVNPNADWPDVYMIVGTDSATGKVLLDPVYVPVARTSGRMSGFNRVDWMGPCRIAAAASGTFIATLRTDTHLFIPGMFDGSILNLPYTLSLPAQIAAGSRINVDTASGVLGFDWYAFRNQQYSFRLSNGRLANAGSEQIYDAEPVHPANPLHNAMPINAYTSLNASLLFGTIHSRIVSVETDELEATGRGTGDQWGGRGGEIVPGWRSSRYHPSVGWGGFRQTFVVTTAPREIWPFGRTR